MKKNFLMKLGAIVSVFTPFMAVVSCGKKTTIKVYDVPNEYKDLQDALKKIDFTGRTSKEFASLQFDHEEIVVAAKDELAIEVPDDVQSAIDLSALSINVSKKANSDILAFTYDDGSGDKALLDIQVKTFLPSEAASIMTLLKSSNKTVKTQSRWSTAYTKSSGDYGQLLNSGGQISFIGVANRKAINEALAKVKNKAEVWVSKRGSKEEPSNTLTYTLVYSLDAEDTKRVVPHVDVEFTKFCPDELDNIIFSLSHIYRTKLSQEDFLALTLDKDLKHDTVDGMNNDIGYNGVGLIVLFDKGGTTISDVPLTGDLGSGGSVHVKKEAGTAWLTWTIKYENSSTPYNFYGEITVFSFPSEKNPSKKN